MKLLSGNIYTPNGVVDFIKPLIEHCNEKFPETIPLLCGDSGFAVAALYDLFKDELHPLKYPMLPTQNQYYL